MCCAPFNLFLKISMLVLKRTNKALPLHKGGGWKKCLMSVYNNHNIGSTDVHCMHKNNRNILQNIFVLFHKKKKAMRTSCNINFFG